MGIVPREALEDSSMDKYLKALEIDRSEAYGMYTKARYGLFSRNF